jgi:hypothetical protein
MPFSTDKLQWNSDDSWYAVDDYVAAVVVADDDSDY